MYCSIVFVLSLLLLHEQTMVALCHQNALGCHLHHFWHDLSILNGSFENNKQWDSECLLYTLLGQECLTYQEDHALGVQDLSGWQSSCSYRSICGE